MTISPGAVEFAKYVAVPLGATAVRLIFWFRSPEKWVAFCERQPRLAALLKVARAVGVDPLQVFDALAQLAAGRTPPGPPAYRSVPPPADTQPSPDGVVKDLESKP